MKSAIWKYEQVTEVVRQVSGKRTVLVGGCFDVLHYGHIVFLQEARKRGDFLIIALESDDFIRAHKKREPIHTQDERSIMLAELRSVDGVLELPLLRTDTDYARLVEHLCPAVIAVTDGDPSLVIKTQHAARVGATVEVVTPLLSKFSTTKIRS